MIWYGRWRGGWCERRIGSLLPETGLSIYAHFDCNVSRWSFGYSALWKFNGLIVRCWSFEGELKWLIVGYQSDETELGEKSHGHLWSFYIELKNVDGLKSRSGHWIIHNFFFLSFSIFSKRSIQMCSAGYLNMRNKFKKFLCFFPCSKNIRDNKIISPIEENPREKIIINQTKKCFMFFQPRLEHI